MSCTSTKFGPRTDLYLEHHFNNLTVLREKPEIKHPGVTRHRSDAPPVAPAVRRTDAAAADGTVQIEILRFEVREGRITVWRDYFDLTDIENALLRGMITLRLPSMEKPGDLGRNFIPDP